MKSNYNFLLISLSRSSCLILCTEQVYNFIVLFQLKFENIHLVSVDTPMVIIINYIADVRRMIGKERNQVSVGAVIICA